MDSSINFLVFFRRLVDLFRFSLRFGFGSPYLVHITVDPCIVPKVDTLSLNLEKR